LNPNRARAKKFFEIVKRAARIIRESVEKGSFIQVLSHLDADGLASAGILGRTLSRLDAEFHIQIVKQIDEALAEELCSDSSLTILSDLGSGYLDLLKEKLSDRVIILDHHQPIKMPTKDFVHVNPHLQGFDGSKEISGAGIAYLTAKALDKSNVDLACTAVVGALGDLQDIDKERKLFSLNNILVKDAAEAGYLKVDSDMIFYGRETRPIHKGMAYTTNPFIPGLSGEEDKCLGFLVNVGIEIKRNDRWTTLSDLSVQEKQKLFSEIAKFLATRGFSSDLSSNLIGAVYTLTHEDRWTPLRDAREFSSLLNACGRMDKAGLGVSICMGAREKELSEALEILKLYRQTIAKGINWLLETPEAIQEHDNIYIVSGKTIDEKMISPITSILATTGVLKSSKPIVAFARMSNGMVKVSGRASSSLVESGVNLGTIFQEASENFSGRGGGHDVAAGAQIPSGSEFEFAALVEEFVEKKLGKNAK